MWTFGFGSNMNVKKVESKKGHKVLDSIAGVVKGYKMCFNALAMPKVEPAFANAVKGMPDDSIHGVAIQLSAEDMAKLDAQEAAYDKVTVSVEGYTGRIVESAMYIRTKGNFLPPDKQTPSNRYLQLLVDGAKEAGLNSEYISRLQATTTYSPDERTISLRKQLPEPQSLNAFTVEELFATKIDSLGNPSDEEGKAGELAYVAVLGYVMKMPRNKCIFSSHLGRDLTARSLRHFRGQPLDKDDDMGRPPYPDMKTLGEEEKEYLHHWLDHYLDKAEVVGYVSEYLQQQQQ